MKIWIKSIYISTFVGVLVAQSFACVTSPGKLEINVSGAAESPTTSDYYVVAIPLEGDPAVKVTITGSGQVSCPEECVCDHDSSITTQPNKEGEAEYTFVHTVGEQSNGGTGNKIEWDINSLTSPGEYTFRLTEISQEYADCPDDYSGGSTSISNDQASDEIKILAVRVEMVFPEQQVCDGKRIDVDLLVYPSSIGESNLSNGSFLCTKPDGSSDFDNPSGQGSNMLIRGNNQMEWKIDNARWYDTGLACSFQAAWKSGYKVSGSIEVYGIAVQLEDREFDALATPNTCLYGYADLNYWYSGLPSISVSQQKQGPHSTVYKATIVGQGSALRDVSAYAFNGTYEGSQYFGMVQAEEDFHVMQFEGTVSSAIDPELHFVMDRVIDALINTEYTSSLSSATAILLAQNSFHEEAINEDDYTRSFFAYPGELRCAIETDAKIAAQATHLLIMECAYGLCP